MASGRRIDAIDAKIIKDLLKDGRKSFVKIAKECHVTSATIGEHYSELEKAGIIVGATIQQNSDAFGQNGVATLLLNVESQAVNEVLERLRKMTQVYVQRQYNVEHNIMVIAGWKKPRDLDNLKETIRRQNTIIECKTYLWTDVTNTPENLTIGPEANVDRSANKASKINPVKKNSPVEVDEVDRKIAERLNEDGRLPFRRIAQDLGMSTDTISKRYTKLKENSVIKSTIQINPKALGYNAVVHFSLAFTVQNEIDSVIETLLHIPNVMYIVKVEGDFDLHVAALARDISEIFAISEKITSIPHIKKLETALREPPVAWPGKGQHISTLG